MRGNWRGKVVDRHSAQRQADQVTTNLTHAMAHLDSLIEAYGEAYPVQCEACQTAQAAVGQIRQLWEAIRLML